MGHHILVVDDEIQIRELLCVYLKKQGFTVSSAGNSKDTLTFLHSTPVDLVVLDIGLAEEDGLKVLPLIKKERPNVQVVMLTGMGIVEDFLQEAHQKGADGYVSKELPLDELLMTIRKTLNHHNAQMAVGQ